MENQALPVKGVITEIEEGENTVPSSDPYFNYDPVSFIKDL
jgi:hypothetical protein